MQIENTNERLLVLYYLYSTKQESEKTIQNFIDENFRQVSTCPSNNSLDEFETTYGLIFNRKDLEDFTETYGTDVVSPDSIITELETQYEMDFIEIIDGAINPYLDYDLYVSWRDGVYV